jgi:hypothetical protein
MTRLTAVAILATIMLTANVASTAPFKLAALNVDKNHVAMAGLGHSADFAHQFHIAFSATVSGTCLFSAQPFNCAGTSMCVCVSTSSCCDLA